VIRSELVQILSHQSLGLDRSQVDHAMKALFAFIGEKLGQGKRIEVRGFGCFSVRRRAPKTSRNPKTGELVSTELRYLTHFKPGKALKEAVNQAYQAEQEKST